MGAGRLSLLGTDGAYRCCVGGKADPTKIRIGTLNDCVKDPLAAKMRWKLRKDYNIELEKVPCIFSVEKTTSELLPLSEEQKQHPGVRHNTSSPQWDCHDYTTRSSEMWITSVSV